MTNDERLGPRPQAVDEIEADGPVYRTLGRTLGVGVAAGLAPIVVGLVLALIQGGIPGGLAFPGLGAVVSGIFRGDAVSLIFAGVIVLLALPPLQAAVAAVSFWSRGNRRFALTAAGVLAVQAAALGVAWLK